MTNRSAEESLLVSRLRALLELLPPALDRQVAPFGLTSYEYALLDTVAESEEGRLRLSRVASSTNATLPRVSRVINALEAKGLVRRAPSEDAARATDAVLTPAGRAAVDAARPRMNDAVKRTVTGPLNDDEVRAMSSAIASILGVLERDGRLAATPPPGEPSALRVVP